MKPQLLVVLLAMNLVACVSPGHRGSTADDIAQAKASALTCTGRQAARLDDQVSEAHLVGKRVVRSCRTEWTHYVRLLRPAGRRTAFMVGWYHQMEIQQRTWATQAVLLERSRQALQ
ncbi:MAG: hypothetical protein WA888_05765 [Burkholderiaceae bacterium]